MKHRSQPTDSAVQAQERSTARNATRRRLLGWSAGGGAGLLGALAVKVAGTGQARAQAPSSIVGSWLITFPTGSDDPNEHQVVSFTSDGIVVNTSSPSSPPDPERGAGRTYSTAGQGAWVASGAGQVRLKFMSVDTDEAGNFNALVQITATAQVSADGNSFSGSYQVQVSDAGGNVVFASPGDAGTVQGTRISV